MSQDWSRLDNAAKIFPSVTTRRITHLFRLSVKVDEPVRRGLLADALAAVLPRFPSFQVKLAPGLFWYTLVPDPTVPHPVPDTTFPCQPFRRRFRGTSLLRVRWFGRRIAVEFSHTLTDGMGGLVFLKALAAEYLAQAGLAPDQDPEGLRRLAGAPEVPEDEDAFQALHEPAYPRFETWNRSYRAPGPLVPLGQYAVTTGRLAADQVLALAKARGATLTEFLAATLLAAFQDRFLALPEAQRRRRARPLRLVLPVNLRPVFGSSTLRNFFVVVPVEIDLRLGVYEFDELLRQVHHQLQAEMDPKLLRKQVVRNLRGELNPVARLLPLPLKNLVLSTVYGAYEAQHTASLSNLGRVAWPEPWGPHLEHLDFVPPPSPVCPANVGVVTLNNQLSITFGSLAQDRGVERAFFTRLRRLGVAVKVESNRPLSEKED